MPDLPEAIALGPVQKELAETKAFPELERKIRIAMTTQSCHSDLKEAVDCLAALNELRRGARGWRSRNRDVTESALFRMVILLYARATYTNAQKGERGPIQIHASLTAEQLLDHKAIVDVRNMAQAHVYLDQQVADEDWHRTECFLLRVDDGWQPNVASNRILVAPRMLGTLNRQVPVANDVMKKRGQERLRDVAHALARCWGPEIVELLRRHRRNLVDLFGSEEEAHRVAAGTAGHTASWVYGG